MWHTVCFCSFPKGRCYRAVLRARFSRGWIDCRHPRCYRRCRDRFADCVDSLHHRDHSVGDPSRYRTERSRRLVANFASSSGARRRLRGEKSLPTNGGSRGTRLLSFKLTISSAWEHGNMGTWEHGSMGSLKSLVPLFRCSVVPLL